MHTLPIDFTDIPLVVEDGVEAGLVSGSAELTYDGQGLWTVYKIWLDGHRKATDAEKPKHGLFVRQSVEIDHASYPWLHRAILHQLEHGTFALHAGDAVASALEENREAPGSYRARALQAAE